jgi:maltooligosyltrehalose trehalohydrolase
MPIGAEVIPTGGVEFRVCAPAARSVDVLLGSGRGLQGSYPLAPGAAGHFTGVVLEATPGMRYRLRLDGEEPSYPDPVSRYQPEGPHGPSEIVDAESFTWTDSTWPGVGLEGQVLYEVHVGTFTPEGTWAAATAQLDALATLGVTVLEIMPVADFPGRFGWGYDGVCLFAPTRLYGGPDDFRRFVDEAHRLGLGVILDVVYNHLGPDGNHLARFAPDFFTDRHENEWGPALNFDGPGAAAAREFVLANAGYWIDEFHLDGLRLDATQAIHDESPEHILTEVARTVRAAARGRRTIVVAENEPQDVRLLRPAASGGHALDAVWNDDFHHTAMVALTGRREAYYRDHRGTPQELLSAVKWGWLFQGQFYAWQDQPRGTASLDVAPAHFVTFLQNHDQVANSLRGERIHQLASPARLRALTALLLLAPGTPMLFQGQEFHASSPFLYFADHRADLAADVGQGRAGFLRQFPSIAGAEAHLDPPHAPTTFERCKLDPHERHRHPHAVDLHRDLLTLRRTDPTFRDQRARGVDGAVLGDQALALRFLRAGPDDRLLIVNLGGEAVPDGLAEPLLAPPAGQRWRLAWSSDDCRYGGPGITDPGIAWRLPAEAALVMVPEPLPPAPARARLPARSAREANRDHGHIGPRAPRS